MTTTLKPRWHGAVEQQAKQRKYNNSNKENSKKAKKHVTFFFSLLNVGTKKETESLWSARVTIGSKVFLSQTMIELSEEHDQTWSPISIVQCTLPLCASITFKFSPSIFQTLIVWSFPVLHILPPIDVIDRTSFEWPWILPKKYNNSNRLNK